MTLINNRIYFYGHRGWLIVGVKLTDLYVRMPNEGLLKVVQAE